MNRKVDRKYIDSWVTKHRPNGIEKLAEKAEISSSMMNKVRIGRVPKREYTRRRICRALKIQEDFLFPPVAADVEEAS